MGEGTSPQERVVSALAREEVVPPCVGVTYLDEDALAGAVSEPLGPAARYARFATDAGLDFMFVRATWTHAPALVGLLRAADRACLWSVDGPLWPTLESSGIARGLKDTVCDPARLRPAVEHATDRAVVAVGNGATLGVTAVVVADDLAGSAGPLLPPDYVLSDLMPHYARVASAAAHVGMPAVFHSDGDIRVFFPALARAGFTAVHVGGGLDVDGFEALYWNARKASLAVIGGIGTRELGRGPVAAASLGSRIGVLAKAGGLLIADDGGITTAEEVGALVSALKSAKDECAR